VTSWAVISTMSIGNAVVGGGVQSVVEQTMKESVKSPDPRDCCRLAMAVCSYLRGDARDGPELGRVKSIVTFDKRGEREFGWLFNQPGSKEEKRKERKTW